MLLALVVCRSAAAPPEASLIAELDRNIPELLERDHVPGVSVALVEKGEVVWSKGYGVVDTRTGAPITPQYVFAHGSNSAGWSGG
jgi:CubicO group peptidase (beta-lactamase class C family)